MSFDVQHVTDAMVETAWRIIHKDTACDCRECIRKALVAALAQSDAEPTPDDNFERHMNARISKLEHEIEELQRENKTLRAITRGVQKAAASAGLIEAAECLEASNTKWGASCSPCVMSVAKWLRARAADGGGK